MQPCWCRAGGDQSKHGSAAQGEQEKPNIARVPLGASRLQRTDPNSCSQRIPPPLAAPPALHNPKPSLGWCPSPQPKGKAAGKSCILLPDRETLPYVVPAHSVMERPPNTIFFFFSSRPHVMLTWMIIFIILTTCKGWVTAQVGSAKTRVQRNTSTHPIPSQRGWSCCDPPAAPGSSRTPGITGDHRGQEPLPGWDVPSKSHPALGTQEGWSATSQPQRAQLCVPARTHRTRTPSDQTLGQGSHGYPRCPEFLAKIMRRKKTPQLTAFIKDLDLLAWRNA